MLTIYRRHRKGCKHRAKGRKHRHCQCPIWVDGFLSSKEIRESLKLRDWQKALERVREWEIEDRLTRASRYPADQPAIARFRGFGSWLISEFRVSSFDRARDAVDFVTATIDPLAGVVENAIFRVNLVDGRAPASGVVSRRKLAGSLTVAAEQTLHTSQPSLSRQIRDLEDEVGARLLTRRARGIELTPAGRAFLEHARSVLSQVAAATEAARRVAHPTKPCFSIGFLTGHESAWMPEALRILRNELPNIDVMISSG
jgi:hypothetical protein